MNLKTITHKLLALLLTIVMVLGMLPVTAQAYSLTSGVCSECSEYKSGEICTECNTCVDCISSGSAPYHCVECSKCFPGGEATACEDSDGEGGGGFLCEDCCKDFDYHCEECGNHVNGDTWCPEGGSGSHCLYCIDNDGGFFCGDCETIICPFCENVEGCGECNFCSNCIESMMGAAFCEGCGDCLNCMGEGEFCPNCFLCQACTVMCEDCYENCNECTIVCEECHRCNNCAEICEDCELCMDCCLATREDAGCECGDYCPESSDFEDHICSQCDTPFCSTGHEQCSDCELCEECCAFNSDCSLGLCVEDSEYDAHFCLNCYECFDDVAPCDFCVDRGEYYCVTCCAELVADAGCDCDKGHVAGLKEHMEKEHNEEEYAEHGHTEEDFPVPYSRWAYDAENHWHECRACDPENPFEAHVAKKKHTFGADDTCTVCGCPRDMTIIIKSQPKKVRNIPVCPADAWPSDELGELNNYVTFTVSAKSLDPKAKLQYQWHLQYTDSEGEVKDITLKDNIGKEDDYNGNRVDVPYTQGTKTPSLRMAPVECEPENKYYYYCVISDGNGHSVSTKMVNYTTEHVFIMHTHDHTAPGYPETLFEIWRNDNWYPTPHELEVLDGDKPDTLQVSPSNGYHYLECLGDGCTEHDNSTRKPHTMGEAKPYGNYKDAKTKKQIYYQSCTACGWTNYFAEHEHTLTYSLFERTDELHKQECAKCEYTLIEPHKFGEWQDKNGIVCRDCVCGMRIYLTESDGHNGVEYPDWDEIDDKNFVLLTVIGGHLEQNFAKWGESVKVSAEKNGKECLGPKLLYAVNAHGQIIQNADASWGTFTKSFEKTDDSLTWNLTLADKKPENYPAQSDQENLISLVLTFEYDEKGDACNHRVYSEEFYEYTDEYAVIITGAINPTCGDSGYSGDETCERCGEVINKGKILPCTGDHTYDTENSIEHNNGSCIQKAWKKYICTVCSKVIKVVGDYRHNIVTIPADIPEKCTDPTGHTAGEYCTWCDYKKGNFAASGPHGTWVRNNATPATCTAPGFTGDAYCEYCNKLMDEGKVISAQGHSYGAFKPLPTNYTEKHYKECEDCFDQVVENHVFNSENVCTVCGYQKDAIPVILPVGAGYTATAESGYSLRVIPGADFKFKVTISTGYIKSDNFKVATNGQALTPDGNGVYTITAITECQVVTVKGVEKSVLPTMLEGNNGVFTKGSTTGLFFKSSGDFAKFVRVEIDGSEITEAGNYTKAEGSTIITLLPAYLETLAVGPHTIAIVSENGAANGSFTVQESGTNPGEDVADKYPITVINGKATIGAGTVVTESEAGVTITITADTAPAGKMFDKWIIKSDTQPVLAKAADATTTFTMPEGAVTVEATYKDAPVTPGDDPTQPGDDPTQPQTGDNSQMFLWIALLFVSGAGVAATTILGKKKRYNR